MEIKKTKQKTKASKKNAEVAILVPNKTDFKLTRIKGDKEGHYTKVKGSMQQEELMIINICIPNTGASRYMKQVLNDLQRDLEKKLRFPHNNSGIL